uniref:Phenoloxidase inhibitor-like protein n=1 Tax=Simulium nigrimanum TaxID=683695 RepID=D1FQ65_SIMNI
MTYPLKRQQKPMASHWSCRSMAVTLVLGWCVLANWPTVRSEPQQCTKIGDYCTHHDACCSKSCPSFVGKCVSNSQLVAPDLPRPDVKPSIPPTPSGWGQCVRVGDWCQSASDCCSQICNITTRLCATYNFFQLLFPQFVPQYPIPTVPMPVKPISQQCLTQGSKCNNHKECCTNYCNFYARRCVD